MKAHLITAVSAATLLASFSANAAEVTEIARSTDENRSVGMQFNLRYGFTRDTGQIAREQSCVPGVDLDVYGNPRCGVASHVLNRELDYTRNDSSIDLDFRIALPKRLELRVVLPIGISDQAKYAFGKDVSPDNSTIDPSQGRIDGDLRDSQPFFDTYRYFNVADGTQPPKRSGIGDLELHLNWLAMSQETRPEFANLLLGFSYVAPSGPARQGFNKAYGDGVHWLRFRFAASRQIGFIEPYFQALYSAPVGGSRGLFPNDVDNQSYATPGHKLDFVTGMDFDVYSEPESGVKVRVGLGASLGIQTPGRDRSPLFEGLANSECNGTTLRDTQTPTNGTGYTPQPTLTNAHCGWLTQQPGAAQNGDWANGEFHHDGITSVASKLYFGAHARILAQFQRNVGMQLTASWLAYTNHVITNENTGADIDGNNTVAMDFNSIERNPNYNPTMDAPGRRFVFEGYRRLNLGAELYVRF